MKTRPLSFRVSLELHARLEELAAKRRVSVGEFCRALLSALTCEDKSEAASHGKEFLTLLGLLEQKVAERHLQLEKLYQQEIEILNGIDQQLKDSRKNLESVVGIELEFEQPPKGR